MILTVLEHIDRMQSVLPSKTIDDYRADWIFRGAVERSVKIVSVASRRLSDDLRDRYPEVNWRKRADAGNIARHAHDRADGRG